MEVSARDAAQGRAPFCTHSPGDPATRSVQRCRRSDTRAPRTDSCPATLLRVRPGDLIPRSAEDAPGGGVCATGELPHVPHVLHVPHVPHVRPRFIQNGGAAQLSGGTDVLRLLPERADRTQS